MSWSSGSADGVKVWESDNQSHQRRTHEENLGTASANRTGNGVPGGKRTTNAADVSLFSSVGGAGLREVLHDNELGTLAIRWRFKHAKEPL